MKQETSFMIGDKLLAIKSQVNFIINVLSYEFSKMEVNIYLDELLEMIQDVGRLRDEK